MRWWESPRGFTLALVAAATYMVSVQALVGALKAAGNPMFQVWVRHVR